MRADVTNLVAVALVDVQASDVVVGQVIAKWTIALERAIQFLQAKVRTICS